MGWNELITWLPKQEINETIFNEQIYDNVNWLYARPLQVQAKRGSSDETDATDYSGAAHKVMATWNVVLTEETVLEFVYQGLLQNSTSQDSLMDIFITPDGMSGYYSITGTSTKPTAAFNQRLQAGVAVDVPFRQRITLAAGTYDVAIVFWKTGTGTLTRYLADALELSYVRVLT